MTYQFVNVIVDIEGEYRQISAQIDEDIVKSPPAMERWCESEEEALSGVEGKKVKVLAYEVVNGL